MKINVKRAWFEDMEYYNSFFEKYGVVYGLNDATIEIKRIEDLFNLAKELKQDLIISSYRDNAVTIYDDYME